MDSNCQECGGSRIDAELPAIRLGFFSRGTKHNKEFPVKVKVCRQCGRMTYYAVQPQEFTQWIDSL